MMQSKVRKINPEQYNRAVQNKGYLTPEDEKEIFSDADRLGYGAVSGSVFELDGDGFYVHYSISDTCD